MIAQCLYQSDPKNLASMGRQRLACQRAARKLQWGVQKERISETNEPVPLLMRPAVKEILQDAEQHRFDVLLIITHLLHKEPVHATEPAKSAPAPKVYVPSGDIVLGGRNEDDDEENL